MTIAVRLICTALMAAPAGARAAEGDPPERAPAAEAHWEGAIGLRANHAPTYQGAAGSTLKLTPGFFLRYGRFSITNASGFVTRRADDVVRGLGVDLSRGGRLRVSLGLRFDRGRSESTDAALKGLGDVKSTVRARLNVAYALDDGWRLGGGWSVDALGRGGGHAGDVGFVHEMRLSPASVWSWGATLSLAGDRFMQSWYGISEEQAAATGYPVYTPSAGARDIALFAYFRTELSDRWLLLGGAGVSRLVGPAAASPLTRDPNGWGLNVGLAWRF